MRSTSYWGKAINHAPIGYVLVEDGIIRQANECLRDLWAVNIGEAISDFFRDAADLANFHQELLRDGGVSDRPVCLVSKDNRKHYCHVYAQLCESNETLSYAMWVLHDAKILKYRDKVESLSEYNHMLQALVDTIPYPIFCKNVDNHFICINKAYCKAFDVQPEHLIGKSVMELEYLDLQARIFFQNSGDKVIREVGHASYEITVPFADGKRHETLYSLTGFRQKDGSPGGLIGVLIDIAEIREAEKKVTEAKKEVEEQNAVILESLAYSNKIQRSLLPDESVFEKAFADHSIIWQPRDIVGGDIYWIKHFHDGMVLCACDCAGQGTPGALLTMLAVSIFEMSVNEDNCRDTAHIIWELETRLDAILNAKSDDYGLERKKDEIERIRNGCEPMVAFIDEDGTVTFSLGKMSVIVCDGETSTWYNGQNLHVGEGKLASPEEIQTWTVPANPGNKFYIASDGLYEQPGGTVWRPFGHRKIESIILENHDKDLGTITDAIWQAFEAHRGSTPRFDDCELIAFMPHTW